MSVNFSTIRPMDPSTVSRKPTFSVESNPAANSPILNHPRKEKKSHWFLKTLVTAAVVAGAAALLRGKVDMFKNFDKATELVPDAKIMDKAVHYGKKAVAIVGDFVTEKSTAVVSWVKNLFPKSNAV